MALFDNAFDAFSAFGENVEFVFTDESTHATRRAVVSASVFVGESIASDAGARIHSVTGADYSIVIPRGSWPWPFRPSFGMAAKARGVTLSVQSVDEDEIAYTLRCTADERAGTPE